jgi:uncharacterized lipoprotein YbaY
VVALLGGEVRLGPRIGTISGAVLHVYLENVSYADAASEVVAKVSLPGLSHHTGSASTWPFELEVDSVDQKIHYALRAHVDRRGDGRVQAGDCVSTQSYPVLTYGASDRVVIEVRQIN